MEVPYRITIGEPLDRGQREAVASLIEETFAEVDRIYNHYNPRSELSRINSLPALISFPLSPPLQSLLETSDKIFLLSRGRFDPTVLPLQKLWKRHLQRGNTPPIEEQEKVWPLVGWKRLRLAGGRILKEASGMKIDLGGIAKGLCVDLLAERLKKSGCGSFLVDWGGDLRACGKHPEGRAWRVLVSQGGAPPSSEFTLELGDQAVATSGDYLQAWRVDGKKYTHIVNPQSKLPVTGLAGATVVAPTCALADGLATAAMLFDTAEEAKAWASSVEKELPGVTFWFSHPSPERPREWRTSPEQSPESSEAAHKKRGKG